MPAAPAFGGERFGRAPDRPDPVRVRPEAADAGGQLSQRFLRVRVEQQVGGVIAGQVILAESHLDDVRLRWDEGMPAPGQGQAAGAGHQDHVEGRAGVDRSAHRAEVPGMAGGESHRRTARRGVAADRSPQQFGDVGQFVEAAPARQLGAGDQQRVGGVDEPVRGTLDVAGFGMDTASRHRPRRRDQFRVLDPARPHVGGNAEENRPGRQHGGEPECAAQRLAQVIRAIDAERHFRIQLRHGFELGSFGEHTEVLAAALAQADRDDNGRAVGPRIDNQSQRVCRSCDRMDVHERRFPGHPRVTVGHRHDRGFLQAEDIVDVRVVQQRVDKAGLVSAGVAENVFDAPHPQGLAGHVAAGYPVKDHVLTRLGLLRESIGELPGCRGRQAQPGQRVQEIAPGQRAVKEFEAGFTQRRHRSLEKQHFVQQENDGALGVLAASRRSRRCPRIRGACARGHGRRPC